MEGAREEEDVEHQPRVVDNQVPLQREPHPPHQEEVDLDTEIGREHFRVHFRSQRMMFELLSSLRTSEPEPLIPRMPELPEL